MTYTILSAAYANAEQTAAVLQTQEAGAVLASERDTPALWAQMLAVTQPAPYAVVFNQAAALERLREVRRPILDALSGLLADALADGDATLVSSIRAARQGLRDMPQHAPLLAATDDAGFDYIAHERYKALAASLPAAARAAFRDALL